jgi:hypothetical protein
MSRIQRAILYLFPLYLTGMEQLIRTIFSAEAFSVSAVSSSISVGGLAMLLPFLVPSPLTDGLSQEVLDALKSVNRRAYDSTDQNIAISAWFFLVSLTFVWIFSLSKKAEVIDLSLWGHAISLPVIIAFIIYLIGIIHTELKERS